MDIKYKYGDKKPKRMWIDCFLDTGYSANKECNTGYLMCVEIGLNKGIHTYVKGVWCYHTEKHNRPFDWDKAIETYNVNFNQYIEGSLNFAIEKGYCK